MKSMKIGHVVIIAILLSSAVIPFIYAGPKPRITTVTYTKRFCVYEPDSHWPTDTWWKYTCLSVQTKFHSIISSEDPNPKITIRTVTYEQEYNKDLSLGQWTTTYDCGNEDVRIRVYRYDSQWVEGYVKIKVYNN